MYLYHISTISYNGHNVLLFISMGNQQQQQRHCDVTHHHIKLDRPDATYLPNDIISGNVSHLKNHEAFILLTGTVYFIKHKKKHSKNCKIIFFSTNFDLNLSSTKKQTFQFRLDEYLPPSFNNRNTFPNISYSINLVYKNPKEQIHSSIPIRICPLIQIDQPLLLKPLIFGPVENLNYGTKLEIQLNRSAFKFNDTIEIEYELQNPREESIHKIEINLGVYYLVESNTCQKDICDGVKDFNTLLSKHNLIKCKASLKLPEKIYLPPTLQYKYNRESDQLLFNLAIDYKIQFRIYLGNPENIWELDVPIVLCNNVIEQTNMAITDVSPTSDRNVDMTE